MKAKILNLIGLAQKAGKVVSGDYGVTKAIKTEKAKLLLVAADSSENTLKRFKAISTTHGVTIFIVLSKYELGSCIGKYDRAVLAITDNKLANSLLQLLTQF